MTRSASISHRTELAHVSVHFDQRTTSFDIVRKEERGYRGWFDRSRNDTEIDSVELEFWYGVFPLDSFSQNLPVTVLCWNSTAQRILQWQCCNVIPPNQILPLQSDEYWPCPAKEFQLKCNQKLNCNQNIWSGGIPQEHCHPKIWCACGGILVQNCNRKIWWGAIPVTVQFKCFGLYLGGNKTSQAGGEHTGLCLVNTVTQ